MLANEYTDPLDYISCTNFKEKRDFSYFAKNWFTKLDHFSEKQIFQIYIHKSAYVYFLKNKSYVCLSNKNLCHTKWIFNGKSKIQLIQFISKLSTWRCSVFIIYLNWLCKHSLRKNRPYARYQNCIVSPYMQQGPKIHQMIWKGGSK